MKYCKEAAIILALIGFCFLTSLAARGQTPNLVVSAGPSGQAPTLTISSDSQNPLKTFTVSGGSGQYNVVWAESSGTAITIYSGTIVTATSASAGPVTPPAPADLPIGTLTTAVSAAVTGVDQATAVKMGNTYEALAKSIDTGVVVSPLQLQLATGTQLLANFNSAELASLSKVSAAVNGWVDAQQCANHLSADHMEKYSAVYHAVGKGLGAKNLTRISNLKLDVPNGSPCADGKCPLQDVPVMRTRRRR